MKNIATAFLAAGLLLPSATPALAQTTLALTGGVNLASVGFDGAGGKSATKSIRRPSIGLAATVPVWKRLSLHLEGGYSGKGASFRDRVLLDYRGSLKLDYLELSVLGKARVYRSGDGAELHLLAGPAWARQTSCTRHGRLTVRGLTMIGQVPCDNRTSSVDFAMAGGAWLEMWFSDRLGLLLSGRYTLGIHDVDDWVENVTMKNRTWSLRTGALFSIGGN